MSDRIRPRVWLMGLLPPIVVLALVILFVTWSGRAPSRRSPPAASGEAPIASAAMPIESMDVPTPPSTAPLVASPTQAAPPVLVAAAASSVILAHPPPEPIPELDMLTPPPGSQSWTQQQKVDYRQKVFDALDAKERSLGREIAGAQSRGDSTTAQKKQATLDYLRARRAQIEDLLQRAETARQNGDAG